jgi:hypothetical protein
MGLAEQSRRVFFRDLAMTLFQTIQAIAISLSLLTFFGASASKEDSGQVTGNVEL